MSKLACLAAMLLPLTAAALDWSLLPPIPDDKGFAGSFAGVSGGALIVAGGTNFPDKMPWDGGTKKWHDDVFILASPDGPWIKADKLPKPNGYGVSITTDRGLVIVGGGNASEHFRDVVRLSWNGSEIRHEPLPPLPKPCAFMCSTMLGGTVLIAGGIERPDDTEAMRDFWSLDLSQPDAAWQEQPPLPGRGRILAAAGSLDGSVFIFSGASLKKGPDGKPARDWLSDAFRFTPGKGWSRIADLPRAAVAAPSPLPVTSEGRLLVIGGDDGAHANFEPKQLHPGFPRSVLSYDAGKNSWSQAGEVPFSLVTTNAVMWRGSIVIPGGEARPGVRSKEVWRSSQP